MKVIQLKTKAILFSSLILFINCSNKEPYHERVSMEKVAIDEDYQSVKEETKDLSTQTPTQNPSNLKIIKSANAKYKVKDVKNVTNKIKRIIHKNGGYISDLRFENNLYKKENRFSIKVPEARFDELIDSIGSYSEFIDFENITTKDITEEYVDITSRLQTKEEVKVRYENILRSKAKTVEEILKTESKLRIIQEEIDAAKGKLKYMNNKVAFSTIQIDLYETVDYKEEPITYKKSFTSKLNNGFSFGWELIKYAIIGLIYLWPVFLIVTFVYVLLKLKQKSK